jgi:hypothetical protein
MPRIAKGSLATARRSTGSNATAADIEPLRDVQWADWASDGRLLVATRAGVLEVREEPSGPPAWQQDLAPLRPDPVPPPVDADTW